MTRPDVEKLPTDPEELQDHIEKVCRQSKAGRIDFVLSHESSYTIQRQVQVRPTFDGWSLRKSINKEAALFHRRGAVATRPCTGCQEGRGPFTECILLDGFMDGGCTSCYWKVGNEKSQHCSLSNGEFHVPQQLIMDIMDRAVSYISNRNCQPSAIETSSITTQHC